MMWIIWLILSLLFLFLAYQHFRTSYKSISSFKAWKRPLMKTSSVIQVKVGIAGPNIDLNSGGFKNKGDHWYRGIREAAER